MFSALPVFPIRGAVCAVFALKAMLAFAAAPAYAEAPRTLTLSGVIGSAAPSGESWLVFTNGGDTPQAAAIDVIYPENGVVLTRWQSPPIKPQTALVVSAREIELANDGDRPRILVAPFALSFRVTGMPALSVQHLIVRDGAVMADGGCGEALDGAPRLIGNVFGSSAQPHFVSVLEATNTTGMPNEVDLVLLDPANGLPVLLWRETLPGFATRRVTISDLEARAGVVAGGFWARYTALHRSEGRIAIRHRVQSGASGTAADATAVCALARIPEVTNRF
jgi:hypothetical protein